MTFELPELEENEPQQLHNKQSTKHVMVESVETSHKVMSAGQTILFVLLTILFGVMLNATALRTRAQAMEPSWVKSVCVNVLAPFDSVSRATGLTSARQKTREAMDLPRDDKIDAFTFDKDKFNTPSTTAPATLQVLGPNNKLRMWIVGDSLSITPGESMLRNFSINHFDIRGMDGKISTGLSRPDVFNWFSRIREVVLHDQPQVLIATFGANDDQSLFSDRGLIGPFGTQAWRDEYASRVSSTLDYLASKGVYTYWLEIPPVRDPIRNDRYAIINEVTAAAVKNHPSTATYIDTTKAFTMPDGSYQDSVLVNGQLTLVRAHDGIHFTRAGGNVIYDLLVNELRNRYKF